ncbi:MAG TPA: chemotaxis protein CheD [Bacillales bacterium]|nr:chemotaxis protein CheD [Bacillales bacterium]
MSKVASVVKVGIAEMGIAVSPRVIRTVGLGSCVGVVVYDSRVKAAALAHVMLPDSSLAKGTEVNPGKFADTAVAGLVRLLKRKGSSGAGLKAKMAGGAQMFQLAAMNAITRIGPRNVEEIKCQLVKWRIDLVAADIGGASGRTIEFDPETEKFTVRTVHQGETVI